MKRKLFKSLILIGLSFLSLFSLGGCNKSQVKEVDTIYHVDRNNLVILKEQKEIKAETYYSLTSKETVSIILISVISLGAVTAIITYVYINKRDNK